MFQTSTTKSGFYVRKPFEFDYLSYMDDDSMSSSQKVNTVQKWKSVENKRLISQKFKWANVID